MVSPMHMLEFLLAPALVSTPSPRVLMLPPRDMPPSMDTLATMDTTLARGLDASTQGYAPFYGYSGYYGHYLGKRSADAEADADAFYAAYPYAAPVTYAHAGVPFGSSTGLDPITQGLDAATQGYAPYFGYT